MRGCLIILLALALLTARAQDSTPYKSKPAGHNKNRERAAAAYAANLKKYKDNAQVLVLPGIVAHKQQQRVEVLVESTGLGREAACEFMVIGETSGHGYESCLIALAKPSAVHQAIRFIGKEPGAPADPDALRFWARGELFNLSVAQTSAPPVRVEQLIVDRRSGKTLREEGFLFTGSRMVDSFDDPKKQVYAADEYDPKAIVSLFNTAYAVLEVPYAAPQGDVYANCAINPEHALPEGELLTLVIEPANKDDAPTSKDLALDVHQGSATTTNPAVNDLDRRLTSLRVQLRAAGAVLNKAPDLRSVFEALTALDRKKYAYYMTIKFGDDVELGTARALAMLLATIDSERGVRIEPPPARQVYYKAFLAGKGLMDRESRIDHPWELSLTETNGQVSGMLLLIDSVWKDGQDKPEMEFAEFPVAGPQELRKQLDAEAERTRKANRRPKLPVILVFAPASLKYGQLIQFLEPALPTHKTIHVLVDETMPPVPKKTP